ncbi:MAG: nitroreductase [Chloroflexota bacterium]|nr:nitroreductase [Chloroflexota bacterium]
MDVIEAITTRRSIRGYKPDPVPKEMLREILEVSVRAPSAMNTQPWEITVVAGEVLDNIRKDNIEMMTSGNFPTPDISMKPYEGLFKQRQVDLAVEIFQLLGIAREDKEKRAEWMQKGFRFFDAPAAIIVSVDRSLDLSRPLNDIGAIVQTICLTAMNHGLGTCITGQGIMFPEVVRKHTGIPDSKLTILSIAIGYPDWDFPANKLITSREPLESNTTWHGFD